RRRRDAHAAGMAGHRRASRHRASHARDRAHGQPDRRTAGRADRFRRPAARRVAVDRWTRTRLMPRAVRPGYAPPRGASLGVTTPNPRTAMRQDMRRLCAGIATLAVAFAAPVIARDAPASGAGATGGAIVHTGDVALFYQVYDAAHGHPTAGQLQHDYLDRGSHGLHVLARER